jgi:hypothetical protein
MLRRAALVLSISLGAGCAHPYPGPKTLAAVGTALLVVGGTSWVVGERTNRSAFIGPGVVTSMIGAVAVIGAGGWLAASIGCRVDPDCPEGEECKEIPAAPGAVPYKQCIRR